MWRGARAIDDREAITRNLRLYSAARCIAGDECREAQGATKAGHVRPALTTVADGGSHSAPTDRRGRHHTVSIWRRRFSCDSWEPQASCEGECADVTAMDVHLVPGMRGE